jgi:membrane protease YdiL (CAAX protease family)
VLQFIKEVIIMISTETGSAEIRLPQARHAIGFFLLIIFVFIIAGLIAGLIAELIEVRMDTQGFTIFIVVTQSLVTVGVLYVFMRRRRFDWRATLSLHPGRPSVHFWACVGIIPLGMVSGQLASYLVQAAPWLFSENLKELVRLTRFSEPGIYILFAMAISLGPGITEELAFRGFILRGLSARFGALGAVTLTAFLFALLHLDPLHILLAFPVGLYLGYIVVRLGSLYPAILAHTFNNLWSTVEGSLWQAYNPEIDPAQIVLSTAYPPVVLAGAVVLLAIGLYALHRVTKSPEKEDSQGREVCT